jgi:hypothetical protein
MIIYLLTLIRMARGIYDSWNFEQKHLKMAWSTVAVIKHDWSSNGLSPHIFRARAHGSIVFYSPVFWDVADKIL